MAGEKIDQIQSIDKLKEKTIGVFSKLAADYDKHIKNDFSLTNIGNEKNGLIQAAVTMAIQAINDNEIDKANQIIIQLERRIREIHNESPNRAGKYEDSQSYQLIEKLKTEFGDYTTQLDAEISRIRLKQEVLHRLLTSVEDWAVPAASKIEPEKLTTKGEIVKDLEKVERILSGINQAIVSNAKALELNIPGISSEVIEEAKGASLNISQKKQALEARLLKIQEDAINKIKIAQLEINRHLTELSSKLEGLNPTQSDSAEDIVKKLQLLQELETKVNIVDQQSSEKKVELDKTADDAGLNDEQKFRLHSLEAVKLDVVSTKDNLNLRIESLKKSAVDKLNSSVREITQDKIKELKTEAAVKEIQDKVRGLQSAVTKALEAAESANKQMANTGVTDVAPIDVQSAKTELEAAAKKQEELKARLTVIQEARAAVSEAQPKLTAAVAALNAQLAIDPKKLLDAGAIEAAQKEIERLKDAVETVVVAAAEANDKATAAGVVGVAVGAANEALGAIVAKEQELNNRMATIQREAKELIDTAQLDLNTKMENLIAKTDSLFQTSTDTAAIIENNLSTLAELEKSFNTIKQEAKAKKTQLDKIAQDAGIENTFTLVPLKMENGNNTKIETTKLLLTIELATKKVAEAQEKLATAVDALNTKLKTDPKTLNAPKAVQEVKQEIERLKGEVEAAVKEATAANVKANDVGVDGVNMTTANQALESITLINQALSKREKDILDIQKLVDEASKKLQHANSEYGQYNLKLVSFNADAFEGNKSSSDIIKEQIVLESFKQKIEQLMEEAKLVNTKAGDKEVLYTVFMRGAESSLLSIKDREKVLQSELEKAQATEALAAAQGRLDEAVAALNEGLGAIKPAALKDAAGVKAAQKRISDLQQTYENSLKQSGIDTANDLAKAAGVKEVNIEIAKSVPEKISLGLKALDTALQIMQNTANSSKTSLEEALASLNTKIAEINPNELKTVKSANDKIAELRSEKETLKTLLDNYTEKAQAADITDQKLISRAEEVITKNNKQGHLDKRSKQITKAESELKSAQEELSTCQEKLNTAPDQIKPEELTTASEVETQISRLGGLKTKLDDAQKKAEAANTNAVTTNIDARIDTTIDTTKYGPAIEKLNERLGLIQQTTKSVQETQQKLEQAVKELDLAIQIDPKTLSSPGSVQARQQNIAQLTQELNTAKEAAVTAKTSAEQNNINTQTYAEVLVNSQKTLDDSVQQILVQATAKQQDLDSRQEVIGSLLAKIGEAHQQFKLKTKYLNDSLERTPSQTFTSVDAINKKTQDLQELLQGVREAQNSTQQLLVTAKNSNIEANVSTDTAQIEAKVAAQIKELALKYGTMQAEARQAIALANKDLKSKAQQLATEVQAIPTELDSVAKIKLNIGELDKAKKRTSEFNQNANLSATTLDQQARNAGITDKITIPDTLTLSQDIQSKISELETKAENIIQQATQAKQTLDKAVGALNQIPVENLSNLQQIKQGKTKLATANQALKDYTEKAELADSPVNTTDISTTIQKFDGALNTKSEQITQAAADAKQTLEAAVQDINTNIGTITPGTLKINDVETKTGELEGARKQLQELLSDYTQKAQAAEVDPKAQAEAANITLRAISSTQANILAQQSSLALSAYGAQRSLDKAIEELKQIAGQPVEGLKVDGLVQRITKITQAQQQVAVSVKKCEAVSESTGIPIDTSKANPSEADTIKQSIQGRIETIKEAARQKVSAHQDTLDRLATPLGQPNEPFTTAQEIKDEQDRLEKLIAETKTAIATADQINIEARYAKIDGVKTQPATEALDAAQTKLQDLTAQSEQITKAAVEAQDKLNEALASLNDKIAEINPNELKTVKSANDKIAELRSEKETLKTLLDNYTEKAQAADITDQKLISRAEEVITKNNKQGHLDKRSKQITKAESELKSAQEELSTCQEKLNTAPDQIKPEELTTASEVETQISRLGGLKTKLDDAQKKAEAANTNAVTTNIDARIDTTIDTTKYGPAIEKLNERLGLIQQTTKSVQETQQKLEQAVKELDLAIQIDPKTLSSPGSVQARQQNIAQLTQELNTAKEAAVTAKTSAEQNNINTQTYAEVLVNSQKTLDDSVQQILVQATAKQQDLDSRQEVIGSLLAKIGEAHQQFKLKTKYLNDSLERTPSQTFTSVDAINKKTQDLQELLQGVREAQNSTQQLLVTAKNSNIEANVSTDTAQIEAKVAAQIKELALKYGTMQAEARQAIALANKDLKSKAQQLATEVQAIPTELDSVAKIKLNIGELDKAKKRTSEFNQNANLSATTLDQQARNAGITDKITIPDTLTLSQDIQSKISELETKAENIIQQATQAKQTLDKAVGALNQIPVENLSNLQQIKQGKTKLATANQALKDYTEKAELADSPVNTTDISTTIQKFDGALNTKSEQITQAAADAKQTLEAAVQDINTNIGTITPGTLKINDVETKTGELEGARKQLQELLSDYTQKAQAAEVDPKAQAEAANITLRAISSTQANILAQQSSLALSAYGAQRSLDKAIEELKQIAGQPVEGLKVDGLVQRITKITQAQQQVAVSVKKCEAVSESTGIPIDTSKANPSEADTIKQSIQGRIETIKEAARQKVSAHQDTLDRLATPLGQPNEPFTTAQEIKDEQDRLEKLIAETKTAIATADQINIEARYAKIDGVKTQPATEALDAAQTKLQDLTAQSEQITKAAVEAQDKLNEALASLNEKIAEIKPNELNDLATMKKFQTELSECKTNLTSAQVEFKSKADATKISGTMDLSLSSSMFSAFNAQEKANKTLEALTQRITTINEATSAIRSAQDNLNQEIQLKLDSIPEPDTIRSLTNVTEIQSQLDKVESLKKDIIALEDKAKLTNEQLNEKASGAGIQNTFDMTSFETIRGKIEKSSTMLNDKKGAFIVQALTAVKDLDKKVADINQEIEKLPNPITESNQIILAIEQLKSLKSDVEQQFKQFEQLTIPALGDESTKQKIDTSIASYSSAIANLEQTIQSLEQKELDIQAKASASLKTLNSKITDSQELIAKIENLSDPKHAKIDKLTLENYLKDLQELSRELPKMLSSAEKDAKNANQPSLDDQAKMVADFRSKISNYETIINQKLEILRLSAQPSQAFQQQNPTRINPLNSNTQSIVNSAEPISQSPFKGFNIFSRYKEQLDTQKEQNTPLASINFQERVDLKELELFKKEGGVTLTVPTTNHTFQFRHDGKHDAQAILTREGAGIGKEPIAELSDEQRQNIGLDVINMIENVLAKGNNLHFKTSDPYVAEFAKQYVEDLKTKGLKINDSIEGPKTEQPANANAAQKAREDLDIIKSKFSYENDFSNRPWVKEHKESEKKIQEKAPRPPASNP